MVSRKICGVTFLIQLGLCLTVFADRNYERRYGEVRDWGQELDEKMYELDYEKYLNEVFKILQTDKYFHGKMMEEYRRERQTGIKMADHLHRLPDELRKRLDEFKGEEMNRIRAYAKQLKEYGFSKDRIQAHIKHSSMHLDMTNKKTFTPKDLRFLIRETSEHLRIMGELRDDHFKEYEMHKRLELEELMKRLTPDEMRDVEAKVLRLREARNKTKRMHVPLSKPHVLEVWEREDGQGKEDFNLRSFFAKHDLDGDEVWDEKEIDLLLKKEIERFYDPLDEDFDEKERDEELKRMKDYVYNEVDGDRNRYVDMQEFHKHVKWLDTTEAAEWSSLFDKPQFTMEEYEQYAALHRDEVNYMIDQGKITLPRSGIVQHWDVPDKKDKKKKEKKDKEAKDKKETKTEEPKVPEKEL